MEGTSLGPETWLSLTSALASVVFLAFLPFRIRKVRRATVRTRPSWLDALKLTLTVLCAALELASFVVQVSTVGSQIWDGIAPWRCLAAALLSTLGSVGIIWLSRLENRRSDSPSDLIVLYLLALLLLNTAWFSLPSVRKALAFRDDFSRLLVPLRLLVGCLLLITEGWSKNTVLFEEYLVVPPEQRAGLLGRVVFWWINPVLAEGYHGVLHDHRLPDIDEELASKSLRERVLREWDQSPTSLPVVLFRALSRPFLLIIAPRLCLIVFRYSQPVLMDHVIRFLMRSNRIEAVDDAGLMLVWGAITVYVGLAISTSIYQHGINRLEIMVKGSLISLIHCKVLESAGHHYGDGKAIGLATADVSGLEDSAEMFHETWAQVVEVVIGVILLAKHVGWLWPLPLFMIFLSSQMSRHVAKNMKTRQTNWNKASQQRIAATSAMLSSMKNTKMMGMQEALASHVQKLREEELAMAQRMRQLMNLYNSSANALGILAPVMTLVLFAFLAMARGTALDTETAFPTVAILALVTHPANMVMSIIPRAVAAYASFERIQDFLKAANKPTRAHNARFLDEHIGTAAISAEKLSFASEGGSHRVLDNVSFEIGKGSIVACSGPVGAGKTVLARLLVGELAPSSGTVLVTADRIAYCSQTPWLPNKTIKDVIVGYDLQNVVEDTWYTSVLQACCLQHDLDELPVGEMTMVGDKGQNLSGGQRQRVALSRALYQRPKVAILDDTFSALDGLTDRTMSENLFGEKGLFRELGSTVFWITNSVQHFSLADQVLVLDGSVQQFAPWSDMRSESDQILKLVRHEQRKAGNEPPSSGKALRAQPAAKADASKDIKRSNGDFTLYSYYFQTAGIYNVAFLFFCNACYSFFITFPQYWLKWWTEDLGRHAGFYIVGYALLNLFAWASTVSAMSVTVLRIAPRSGLESHRRLLQAVVGAPLSFFSATDIGVILNRFGQDIGMVDKQFSNAVLMLGTQTWKMFAQISSLLVVQYRLCWTLPICAPIVYFVQKIYLRSSRQFRYKELESRSGIYTSLVETTEGLETIRAFGWQRAVVEENARALDASQRPSYLLFCLQRWLNIALDLLVAFIAVATIALAVVLRGTMMGGQMGVALNLMLVANTTLLRLVQSWTNFEISLGAVSRLRAAERETPCEDQPGVDFVPDALWPYSGGLELRSISAAYGADNLAFEHVDLSASSGSTVVICGRTGSGKSSLLLALLRLLEINQGQMVVDGIDLSRVPRHIIRQRCFVTVSQDPFVLADASLHFNLDPFGHSTEEAIIHAMRTAGLWHHFTDHHAQQTGQDQEEQTARDCDCNTLESSSHLILQKPMSSLPVLSGGQLQLLAMARALIRVQAVSGSQPVILLDEVTSSLDPATERLVYDIVQRNFVDQGHTVIMVTHKLGAFASKMRKGRDTVVWMAGGRVEKIQDAAEIVLS